MVISLQYLQNVSAKDTCFLLLISAIEANLRLVGVRYNFERADLLRVHNSYL